MFIFGWRWDYLSISTFSLIPVLFGLTGLLYGGRAVKALTFPILYLLFLVPPPMGILDSITLPMRYMISVLTEIILKFFHYPISREGLLLSIGGHQLYMGEPCSGFRSLVTMLALGLLYVYLIKSSMGKKLILVAAIIPLALLGNLIRVITLCLVTFYFGAAVAQGFFHYFSGAVIFVIMLLGLLGLESLIPSGTFSVKASPISRARKVSPFANNLLIVILLAITALACFALPKPKYQSPDILGQLEIPYRIGPWQGKDVLQELNTNDDRFRFVNKIFARQYSRPDGASLLLLILDAGNFHNPKVCYGSSGYQIRDLDNLKFALAGRALQAPALYAQKGNDGLLITYWLCIDKKITGWAGQKFSEFWRALFNKKRTGLMVRLDVPIIAGNATYSLQSAQDFVTRLFSSLPPSSSSYLFGS